MASTSQATIVGFGQIGGSNTGIPSNFASNVTADGNGYVVNNGTTPNIALSWDSQWDVHTSSWFANLENLTVGEGAWDNEGNTPRVGQLDVDFHTIDFRAEAGFAVVLNSFDFAHTAETAGVTTWDLVLTDSRNNVVWSQSVTLDNASTDTSVIKVSPNFMGKLGEDYRLTFDLTSQTYGSNGRHAIDNLSFNQYPDPAGAAKLKHHFKFDGDAADAQGVAPLTVQGDAVAFMGSAGAAGGYVQLGGSDDYLLADLDAGSQLAILGDYSTFRPFSVTFWVRQTPTQAAANTQAVLGMTTASTDSATYNTGFSVATRETGGLGLRVRHRNGGSGSNEGEINTGVNVSDGEWHHVVAVYQENVRLVYIDGELAGINDVPVAITTNPIRYFAIGAFLRAGSVLDDLAGDVDDVQLYEGLITEPQALQLFQNPGLTLSDELPDPMVDPDTEPADLVDTFIGVTGAGSTVPGPVLPLSSIYPSPDTVASAASGYAAGSPVVGFSQLHASGSGSSTLSYGNFLISPRLGHSIVEDEHGSLTTDVEARPYAFRANLTKWDTDVKVVPTANAAIYEFEFPASDDARVNFDVARKLGRSDAMINGSVEIDLKHGTISGGGTFDGNWNPAQYNVYFYAQVDATPVSGGTWVGSTSNDGTLSASIDSRQPLGAWLRFDTNETQTVRLKVAVSFNSVERARQYLENEIPAWDSEALEAAAKARWNEALGAIETPQISIAEARKFYTALYHSLIQPRNRTGDPAGWPEDAAFWDDHYTLWDTWQTLFPLLAIVEPEAVAGNVNSFAERFQRNGRAETAFIMGKDYQVGQGGDEVDRVILDAFVKDIPGIDWEKVWPLLQFNANRRTPDYRDLGYVSTDGDANGYDFRLASASSTLGFAHGDYAAATIAESLGHTEEAAELFERSGNWRNVWDASATSGGFKGFIKGRSRSGSFLGDAPTSSAGYYQGTSWNYSFNVPHHRDELVELMGGRARFIQRIEYAMGQNNGAYVDYTNEPGFQTTFLFNYAGRPYLTSYWASQLRNRYSESGYPGDEDSGAMASLYFFTTAGFFPMATQDVYYLHGARVPEVQFNVADGKTFTIKAENAGGDNLFIQSALLNGVALNVPAIHHADITGGATVELVMGAFPNVWGTGSDFAAVESDDASAISGWTMAKGSGELTGANSNAPAWGEGADAAADTAVQAAFETVQLDQPGATITFSTSLTLTGITAETSDADLLAWGLFFGTEQNGQIMPGYLATNDAVNNSASVILGRDQSVQQPFYASSEGRTLTTYRMPTPELADGAYRVVLTLSRTEQDTIDYYAALVREEDGVLLSAFTGSDQSPTTFVFNRVGLRVGAGVDVDSVQLANAKILAQGQSTDPTNNIVLVGGVNDSGHVALSWGGELSNDVESLAIRYRIKGSDQWLTLVSGLAPTATSYTNSHLPILNDYEFQIVGLKGDDVVDTSDTVSAQPTASETTYVAKLIESGDIWKFLDNGSDQGTAWRAPSFDDSSWSEGPSKLGYGDSHNTTTIGYGPDSNNKYPTTYFRHHFTVDSVQNVVGLNVDVVRDDGVILYLNGHEIVRDNMPAGEVDYLDWSANTVDGSAETTFYNFVVSSRYLVEGANVLAAEVHNRSGNSSDLGFNLKVGALVYSENAPEPVSESVTAEVDGHAGSDYTGSLAQYVTDPNGDALAFSKVSGPAWLVVNADGSISGQPGMGDIGENRFVISVTDGMDGTVEFEYIVHVDEGFELARAPLPTLGERLRFGVIPDTQGSTNGVPVVEASSVAAKIIELAPELVIEVGDVTDGNSSGDSKLSQLNLLKQTMVNPLRDAGIEYYPVRGNHDSNASSLTSDQAWVWQKAFPWLFEGQEPLIDPTDVPGGSGAAPNYRNYSFVLDTGANTFLIALDEWDGGTDTNYSEWLRAKLAEIRAEHPDAHIFPYSHTGVFATSLHPAMTEYISTGPGPFIEACAEYHIDGWLAGHNHIYDRSMAVDIDNDSRSEFFYITCGSASEKFYGLQRAPVENQRLNHLVDSTQTPGEPIAFQIIEINGPFVTMHNWMAPQNPNGTFTEWTVWDTYAYSRNGGQFNVAAEANYNSANITDVAPDAEGFVGTGLAIADGINSDATYYTAENKTFGLYRNITVGWVQQSQWYDAEGVQLISDIASINGMRNHPTRNRADAYTLSLAYDDSTLSPSQEQQLSIVAFLDADTSDEDAGDWINAASATLGEFATQPVYRAAKADDAVGTWGIDIENNVVWARLDYQGDFAIASNVVDTDGDGLEDAWEMAYFGTLEYGAEDDVDGDGLTNLQEQRIGTDPMLADTDGDLFDDGVEYANGLDPRMYNSDLQGSLLDAIRQSQELQNQLGLYTSSTIVGLAGGKPVIAIGEDGKISLKLQLYYSEDLESWEPVEEVEVQPEVDTSGAGFFMWSPDVSDALPTEE
ncbi:MAG: GH92 family glycosyl hydrolase [Verrucomicrobiota bacterium JB022]|nr:GH92 family glycosyl hydrolase [Verrucomicrobiota bacterium JB022]